MPASLLTVRLGRTKHNTKADEYNSEEDKCSFADIDKAVSFLSHGQDSAQLLKIIWTYIFEDSSRRYCLIFCCKEIVARSPFSSIGFRDYLRDLECSDELAAYNLLLEYGQGMATPLTACTVIFWQ